MTKKNTMTKTSDILIAIISGKRPGGTKARPTELFETQYDRIIISNNSEGYETKLPIIDVPEDYRRWYIANHKNSENAWYAPMNRSYAIKYAREHGYKYLVQQDDNIVMLSLVYLDTNGEKQRRFRYVGSDLHDDIIESYRIVLDETNAAMVGCGMIGTCVPESKLWREGYVYSFFMLNLDICPDVFQGDFEDDIEYRLKCAQMGKPVVQLPWLAYGKIGQGKNADLTGCRAEYARAGLKRGEHMSKLYGGLYSSTMTHKRRRTNAEYEDDALYFKHILRPIKVGVLVRNKDAIKDRAIQMFRKYSKPQIDKAVIKTKRVRKVVKS